jgi:hypothetical protein
MDEVFVSLRIYAPKLVSQWWASIGLLFGLAGFILQVSGLFQPPTIFWLVVAVVTVAIAAFQLFHSDRVAAAERTIERSGPALPHWSGLALQGNRDATYLATVGCSQDPKVARPSTAQFPALDSELVSALGVSGQPLERRSFTSGFETTLYGPQQATLRRAKVEVTGSVFLLAEWRMESDPVDLATVLVRAIDGVRALRRGECARVLGKRAWIGIALMQWPAGGISTQDVLAVQRWSDGQHRGQSVNLFSRPSRRDSDWSVVLAFAVKVLSDAGYVGFEDSLHSLTEDSVRTTLLNRGRSPSMKPTPTAST